MAYSGQTEFEFHLLTKAAPQRPLSKHEIHQSLSSYSDVPLRIQLHENSQTLISFNFSSPRITTIRMHKGFLHATEPLIQALGQYIQKRDKNSWLQINEFAQTGIKHKAPDPAKKYVQQGDHHNLKELFSEINAQYFNDEVTVSISWGPKSKPVKQGLIKKKRRSMCFGHYSDINKHITLNRKLDHPAVEAEFIKYIIYHEILHHTIPSERVNGRWVHHSKEFYAAEKQYPNYAYMQKRSAELLRIL